MTDDQRLRQRPGSLRFGIPSLSVALAGVLLAPACDDNETGGAAPEDAAGEAGSGSITGGSGGRGGNGGAGGAPEDGGEPGQTGGKSSVGGSTQGDAGGGAGVPDVLTVNEWLNGLADWTPPPAEFEEVSDPVLEDIEEDGTTYRCETRTVSVQQNYDAVVALGSAYSQLKPGLILQGAEMVAGRIAPIPLPRKPVDLFVDLAIPNPVRTVEEPSAAQLQTAIASLQNEADSELGELPVQLSYSVATADSFEEVSLRTGIGLKYASPLFGAGLSSTFASSRKVTQKSVVASLIQPMFTISFSDDQLPQPADFFADSVTVELLEQLHEDGAIGDDNLPVYVQSVTYGRIVLFTMTSETVESSDRMATLVQASYAGFSGSVDLENQYRSMAATSQIDVLALGGPSSVANEAIQTGEWTRFFGPAAPSTAVPLSYKVMTLRGPRHVASFGDATSFSRSRCGAYTWVSVHNQVHRACERSAPGGNPTGFTVEDGDRLTVACSREVWSGLFGVGANGPGGNGNPAPTNVSPPYPIPGGPQFGAIARVGAASWFSVGPSYGPAVYSGTAGGLVVGVNDNVGNGDACERDDLDGRFDCSVLVERMGIE